MKDRWIDIDVCGKKWGIPFGKSIHHSELVHGGDRMKYLIIVVMALAVFLVSCSSQIPSNKQCMVDEDCVPSICCHAKDAVNKANAPDCSTTLCSLDCEPGTLDCGQGGIACIDRACTVVFND